MEQNQKVFNCSEHPNNSIVKVSLDQESSKRLICQDCLKYFSKEQKKNSKYFTIDEAIEQLSKKYTEIKQPDIEYINLSKQVNEKEIEQLFIQLNEKKNQNKQQFKENLDLIKETLTEKIDNISEELQLGIDNHYNHIQKEYLHFYTVIKFLNKEPTIYQEIQELKEFIHESETNEEFEENFNFLIDSITDLQAANSLKLSNFTSSSNVFKKKLNKILQENGFMKKFKTQTDLIQLLAPVEEAIDQFYELLTDKEDHLSYQRFLRPESDIIDNGDLLNWIKSQVNPPKMVKSQSKLILGGEFGIAQQTFDALRKSQSQQQCQNSDDEDNEEEMPKSITQNNAIEQQNDANFEKLHYFAIPNKCNVEEFMYLYQSLENCLVLMEESNSGKIHAFQKQQLQNNSNQVLLLNLENKSAKKIEFTQEKDPFSRQLAPKINLHCTELNRYNVAFLQMCKQVSYQLQDTENALCYLVNKQNPKHDIVTRHNVGQVVSPIIKIEIYQINK